MRKPPGGARGLARTAFTSSFGLIWMLHAAACDPAGGGVVSASPGAATDAGNDARDAASASEPDAQQPSVPDSGSVDPGSDAGAELCSAQSACSMPIAVGGLSGDQNAELLSTQGAGSAFVAVEVREDDHGLLDAALSVSATLTSPAGRNFDLFVYAEQDSCTALSGSSTTTFKDFVALTWPDKRDSGSSDTRTVIFEVRHVSGACDVSKAWTLEVRGH